MWGLVKLNESIRLPGLPIVPSLRDSIVKLILPGTPVPGYRLFRPFGTDCVG
jgi:hypothetical protein